jgi:hypothetical protein
MNINNTFVKTFLTDEDGQTIEHSTKFISVYQLLAYGTDDEWDFETELYSQTPEGDFVKL